MGKNAGVLIVEDEMITATSISELLADEDYKVIGVARDSAKALLLSSQSEEPPAVVICDINIMGNVDGVELATQLNKLYQCEIIFLTAYSDPKTLQGAFALKPVMYVVKPYNDAQLLVALQMAFHNLLLKEQYNSSSTLLLTSREKEIVQLVSQGLGSKQISRKLAISIETVKTHRKRMLQKNNLNNFSQLIFLMQQGLQE